MRIFLTPYFMYNLCIKMHNTCHAYISDMNIFLKIHEYANKTWNKLVV